MISKTISSLLLTTVLIIGACKHAPLEPTPGGGNTGGGGGGTSGVPCDPNKVYFQQQVLPILISNCAMSGCHDDASHQNGVVLTSYTSVMATADVRPGNPGSSDLYEVIIDNDPNDRMPPPPRNALTVTQRELIRKWIADGAQNLVCASLCDSTVFTFAAAIKPLVESKCQGCHSSTAAMGGIDLSTYNGIKAKVNDGRLWGSVNHQIGFSAMPKNGSKLSDCELTQIRKWIEAGAPNN